MNEQLQKIVSGLIPKGEFKEMMKLRFYNLKAGLSFRRESNGVYKTELKILPLLPIMLATAVLRIWQWGIFSKRSIIPFKTLLFGKNEYITFAGPAVEGSKSSGAAT